MSRIPDDDSLGAGDPRLDGAGVRVDVRNVGVTDQDQRRDPELAEPRQGWRGRTNQASMGQVLWACGQQLGQPLRRLLVSGRNQVAVARPEPDQLGRIAAGRWLERRLAAIEK